MAGPSRGGNLGRDSKLADSGFDNGCKNVTLLRKRGHFTDLPTFHYAEPRSAIRSAVPYCVEVALVVVAFDAGVGVVEVAVESDGGLDELDVDDTGVVDDAASMITVLVDVAERPFWSVTT
jgi:hypothetical protein